VVTVGFHTFDADEAERLDEASRFRFCSREELLEPLLQGEHGTVVDLGSGIGFYTDEVAPFVGWVHAVDIQPEMHDHYRERGLPGNVSLTAAAADDLPFGADTLDGAFSTMTFHESTTEASMAELARVLAPGGRVVVVDWSARGRTEAGPPLDERYDAAAARAFFERAGFDVELARERSETFRVVAVR
jgi:ubiquinone/menaquinone biosynthesis C-methylase UbiE